MALEREKTMVLPENVNKEKIEAKVEQGILTIQLPKLTEKDIIPVLFLI